MKGVPLVLDGSSLEVLIAGGGPVAARRARALVEGGAAVRVVAPEVSAGMEELAQRGVRIERKPWAPEDIGNALLVIAATDERDLNADIARAARSRNRLINVVDAPEEGNCITPAIYREGDLLIAVSTGGVPSAAARIRDAIAAQLGAPYAEAVSLLGSLRTRLLDAGKRDAWARAREELIDERFCDRVAAGEFSARVAGWR